MEYCVRKVLELIPFMVLSKMKLCSNILIGHYHQEIKNAHVWNGKD